MVGDAEHTSPESGARAPLGRPGVTWQGDGSLGGASRSVDWPRRTAEAGNVLATLGLRPGVLPLRVLAALLDSVLLVVLLGIAYSIVAQMAGIDPELPRDEMQVALEPLSGLLYLVTFAVYLGYQTVCNALGVSPGKRICGLRVVDVHGRAPGLRRGFVRALWSLASSVPPWLGYFAVTWDSERRAWHDRLSGTWVVRAGREDRLRQGS